MRAAPAESVQSEPDSGKPGWWKASHKNPGPRMMSMLFKILKNGRSCHGGDMQWHLPQQQADASWHPGEWHEVTGELVMCRRGLHLTDVPAAWWIDGGAAWVAETEGESIMHDNKSCHRKVRLLRQASDDELTAHNVFHTGHHDVRDNQSVALGSATVKAWGNATVKAWGNATVEAWDNATVEAWGNATVNNHTNKPQQVSGYAVLIDRTKTPPRIIVGWQDQPPT